MLLTSRYDEACQIFDPIRHTDFLLSGTVLSSDCFLIFAYLIHGNTMLEAHLLFYMKRVLRQQRDISIS